MQNCKTNEDILKRREILQPNTCIHNQMKKFSPLASKSTQPSGAFRAIDSDAQMPLILYHPKFMKSIEDRFKRKRNGGDIMYPQKILPSFGRSDCLKE